MPKLLARQAGLGPLNMALDAVELVMSVEEEFSIQIPNSIAGKIYTARQLVEHIEAQLQNLERPQPFDAVFKKVRQLTCEQLGIEPERVTPDARFVQDLGLD